jgi:hypothetical protein
MLYTNEEASSKVDERLDTRTAIIEFKPNDEKEQDEEIYNSLDFLDDKLDTREYEKPNYLRLRDSLISLRNRDEIIENALKIVCDELKCQVAAIFLFSKDGTLTRAGIQGVDKNNSHIENDWFPREAYKVGQSFTGRAAFVHEHEKYGRTITSNSFGSEAENKDKYIKKLGKLNCAIAVPLNGRNQTYGVLRIINKLDDTNNLNAYDDKDLELVSFLGGAIAASISNYRRDLQSTILKYIQSFHIHSEDNDFDESEFYEKILGFLVGPETAFKVAILRVMNQDFEELVVKHFYKANGISEEKDNDPRKLNQGFVGGVAKTRKPRIVRNINNPNVRAKRDEFINLEWIDKNNLVSFGCFPIIHPRKQELLGTLSLFTGYEYKFYPNSIEFIKSIIESISSIEYKGKKKKEIKKKFSNLVNQWCNEAGFISSTDEAVIHPAYQQIIGMGESVLPLLLEELTKRSGRWFWALRSITGENPVPENHRGRTKEMIKDWIDWGKKKGYIQ